jgi:hypothetical protein
MEDFKQYADPGADDAERDALKKVRLGFEQIQLEKKVAAAGAVLQGWQRRRRIKNWIAFIAGLLVAGAFVFWLLDRNEHKLSVPPPVEEQKVQNPLPPVAERPLTPKEKAENPLVRGVSPDLDPASARLLKDLLGETVNNPGAFLTNYDWGKCIQLLRAGKSNEAKILIFQLGKRGGPSTQEAAWLRGLTLLAEGKTDKAKAIFEDISQSEAHPRRTAAKKALVGIDK